MNDSEFAAAAAAGAPRMVRDLADAYVAGGLAAAEAAGYAAVWQREAMAAKAVGLREEHIHDPVDGGQIRLWTWPGSSDGSWVGMTRTVEGKVRFVF